MMIGKIEPSTKINKSILARLECGGIGLDAAETRGENCSTLGSKAAGCIGLSGAEIGIRCGIKLFVYGGFVVGDSCCCGRAAAMFLCKLFLLESATLFRVSIFTRSPLLLKLTTGSVDGKLLGAFCMSASIKGGT